MKIVLTAFAIERHFQPDSAGTFISDCTPEAFDKMVECFEPIAAAFDDIRPVHAPPVFRIQKGYAPFCKLLFVANWTDARAGTLGIIPDNCHLLKSEYKSRTDRELPVLVRWLEISQDRMPRAKVLCLVLYNKEQLATEGTDIGDADYGIVAVLGQMHDQEEPINPATMLRNALGMAEGGSGVAIDREAYLRSVEFWNKNAAVKIAP